MICKRLIVDFRKDVKYWVLLVFSLVAIVFFSNIEGEGIRESIATTLYIAMFLLLMVVFFDIFYMVLQRAIGDYYWVVFLIGFAVLYFLFDHFYILTSEAVIGLVIAAAIFSCALGILSVYRSR